MVWWRTVRHQAEIDKRCHMNVSGEYWGSEGSVRASVYRSLGWSITVLTSSKWYSVSQSVLKRVISELGSAFRELNRSEV